MSLNDVAALHNLVTVVDAAAVFEQLATMDSLTDRGWNDVDGDKRTVAHLLCDQLEFADLLLLNKCDLVSEAQLGAVEAFLRKSNPTAEVCPRLRRPRHRRPLRRPLQHRRRVSRSRLSTLPHAPLAAALAALLRLQTAPSPPSPPRRSCAPSIACCRRRRCSARLASACTRPSSTRSGWWRRASTSTLQRPSSMRDWWKRPSPWLENSASVEPTRLMAPKARLSCS